MRVNSQLLISGAIYGIIFALKSHHTKGLPASDGISWLEAAADVKFFTVPDAAEMALDNVAVGAAVKD